MEDFNYDESENDFKDLTRGCLASAAGCIGALLVIAGYFTVLALAIALFIKLIKYFVS